MYIYIYIYIYVYICMYTYTHMYINSLAAGTWRHERINHYPEYDDNACFKLFLSQEQKDIRGCCP